MKVIIIGMGVMGSAAAYNLARRGHEVVGLDANPRQHTLGSSHGTTRIIRQAYFEAPEYVPLLRRSYELWNELQAQCGKQLMELHGGLFIGDDDSYLVAGARQSAVTHSVPYEMLSAREIKQRFSCFDIPDKYVGVFEPSAGVLVAEECLNAFRDLAEENGAKLHFNEPVLGWDATADGAAVETSVRRFDADAIVIAAGPWAPKVLSGLELPLHAIRVFVGYFEPDNAAAFAPERCPIWCIDEPDGFFYGFPYEQNLGMKIARHGSKNICTPESCDRIVHPEEIELLRSKLQRYLPGAATKLNSSVTCMYTMTPDENFVINVADNRRMVYASGFSGHGFKFGTVMGEVIADLITTGGTGQPIDFLSANRFVRGKAGA